MNKKLKKIIGITTSLVLSLCMLTGCSSSNSASSSTSSDASKNQSEKPVSYTHLDVYKRQLYKEMMTL